jgi:hypothetical protein
MAVPAITGSALPFSLAQDLHPVARFFPSVLDKFHKYVRPYSPWFHLIVTARLVLRRSIYGQL